MTKSAAPPPLSPRRHPQRKPDKRLPASLLNDGWWLAEPPAREDTPRTSARILPFMKALHR